MADRIVLNTPRYKGEYELDVEDQPLTALEWRWVKKISDYMPTTISDGWEGADPDLFVAFAVIALSRAGRVEKKDALMVAEWLSELPFDGNSITVASDPVEEAEGDADDPPAGPASESTPMRSIGGSSRPTSDHPDHLQSVTGVPA